LVLFEFANMRNKQSRIADLSDLQCGGERAVRWDNRFITVQNLHIT